jgi:hypothetical protein
MKRREPRRRNDRRLHERQAGGQKGQFVCVGADVLRARALTRPEDAITWSKSHRASPDGLDIPGDVKPRDARFGLEETSDEADCERRTPYGEAIADVKSGCMNPYKNRVVL